MYNCFAIIEQNNDKLKRHYISEQEVIVNQLNNSLNDRDNIYAMGEKNKSIAGLRGEVDIRKVEDDTRTQIDSIMVQA